MSKTRKRKKDNSAGLRVLKTFNIPLPDELDVPIILDVNGLRAVKDGIGELKTQIIKLRNMESAHQKQDVVPPTFVKALATIATNIWRAKGKMIDSSTGEIKEDMRRVYRHIEAIAESLEQIGVMTIDPVGCAFDSGMALKVISFEPTQGLSNEEIKETIRPSIAWQGRLIQMGEVIVGTPQTT